MKKIITLGTTAIMGLTSLGITPFVVHADTAKSGDTVVSYKGQAQPQPWALSVPATVNETKEGESAGANFKYGVSELAIVDADGKAFEYSSKDRTFSLSGTSQYMYGASMMQIRNANDQNVWAWLYGEVTDQGAKEPTALTDKLKDSTCNVSTIQNLQEIQSPH